MSSVPRVDIKIMTLATLLVYIISVTRVDWGIVFDLQLLLVTGPGESAKRNLPCDRLALWLGLGEAQGVAFDEDASPTAGNGERSADDLWKWTAFMLASMESLLAQNVRGGVNNFKSRLWKKATLRVLGAVTARMQCRFPINKYF